jgi:hypothetical protein
MSLRAKLLAAAAECPEGPVPDNSQQFQENYLRLVGSKVLTGSYAVIPPFYRPLPKDEDVLQQKLRLVCRTLLSSCDKTINNFYYYTVLICTSMKLMLGKKLGRTSYRGDRDSCWTILS